MVVLRALGRRNDQGEGHIAPRRPEGRALLVEARRRAIAERLRRAGAITVTELERAYGVSPMTARRDLAELERRGAARRTHGGAVLPTISAHEDSFGRRLQDFEAAKRQLAVAAVEQLSGRETIFLDSSSTTYFVAQRLLEVGSSATVLTNSLPIMELALADGRGALELIGIGGTLRSLTRSFVGPFAVRTVRGHYADRLFLSCKGIADSAILTDADPLEAELKRAMIEQSSEATLLIDQSKLKIRGLSAIAPVGAMTSVLAVGLDADEAAALGRAGTAVDVVGD